MVHCNMNINSLEYNIMAKKSKVSLFLDRVQRAGKHLDKMSDHVNTLVMDSVVLLWEKENIQVINSVVDLVHDHMKGGDVRALITFYRKCVPFTFNKKKGQFEKKDSGMVESMADTWAQFILENNWYDFSQVKAKKEYEFDMEKLQKYFHNQLQKAYDAGQLDAEKLKMLDGVMNAEIMAFTDAMLEDALIVGEPVQQDKKAA